MRALLQAFGRDHHHLVALLAAARRELSTTLLPESRATEALAVRLRRHMRLEEDLVFPAVEQLVGDAQFHLTATLRREHRLLRQLLSDVELDLKRDNVPGAIGNLAELDAALRTHKSKEERVLYPMADRLVAPRTERVLELLEAPSAP